jgi:hypothetical protein
MKWTGVEYMSMSMKIKNDGVTRKVNAFLLKEEVDYQTVYLVLDGVVLKTNVHEKCERIDAVEIQEIADNPMAGMNMKSLLRAKDFTWSGDVREDIFPIALPMMIVKGTVYGIFNRESSKSEVF